jgi:hypothetical protein
VLKVVAKTRTGRMNFTEATQKALQAEHGERTVSLGGSFVIKKGKAKLHVMPDFSKTPLKARVVCVPLGLSIQSYRHEYFICEYGWILPPFITRRAVLCHKSLMKHVVRPTRF